MRNALHTVLQTVVNMKSNALEECTPMVAKMLLLACGMILTTQSPRIALYTVLIISYIVMAARMAMEIQLLTTALITTPIRNVQLIAKQLVVVTKLSAKVL